MLKLLAVPELNLRVSDIEPDAELSHGATWTPTSWFAPQYDPVAMVADMVEVLNGEGGQVEQTFSISIRRAPPTGWRRATRQRTSRRTAKGQPFDAVAQHAVAQSGQPSVVGQRARLWRRQDRGCARPPARAAPADRRESRAVPSISATHC